ncbi:hypothetical protein ACFL59_05955 [Planctomycetota bacterium]
MRTAMAVLLSAFLLSGCDAGEQADGYAGAAVATQGAALNIGQQSKIDGKCRAFTIKHGRKPSTIEELEKSEGALPAPPPGKKYELEASSGRVKLVDAN